MKKRILSILLAVALLLSVGVVPARAADSCVSVKADAATTAEVVATCWKFPWGTSSGIRTATR